MKSNLTLTYLFTFLVIGLLSFTDSFAQKKIPEVSTFNLIDEDNPNIKIIFSINTSKKEINLFYDKDPVRRFNYYDYKRYGNLGFNLSLLPEVKAPVTDAEFHNSDWFVHINHRYIFLKSEKNMGSLWKINMDLQAKMEQFSYLFFNLLGLKPQEQIANPSTSTTPPSNTTTKKTTTNTPPPAPKKKVIKYISTKDIIEKPFCCVNGTWETITIQDLISQLKANGYSQPDKLDDSNYFYLFEMESHIHDIIIDHCYATFDENGKLKRYTACYLGRKYSKEQIQKTVEQIQDDIKNMGAVIHFERKGSDMLAYYKDKKINIDFHEVSDKLYSLDITISKDSNPINKTIYPKEFTLQELLNLPFGFIKSNNQEEILKILRTNKWKIEPSSLHIHSTEEGYSMFGIPIKRFDSFFMRGKLTSFNFHGSEPLSSNQGEKYLRVYTRLQEEFKSMGAKITTIQKKKNWKKFKAEFGDRSVEVTYNSSNEVIGYQLDIDVDVK